MKNENKEGASRKVVGEVQKNTRQVVQVSINEFKGSRNIDLRVWNKNEDGQLLPTKKGVSLNPAHCPRLVELIQSAINQL